MAGHALLVIHRSDQDVSDLMEPYQETQERSDGIWDYWGAWGAYHTEEYLGVHWSGDTVSVPTEELHCFDDDTPPPILTPEGQWLSRPECFTNTDWRFWFFYIVRKYPGHRATLVRYHC